MRGKESARKEPALQPLRIYQVSSCINDPDQECKPMVSTAPDEMEKFTELLQDSDSKVAPEVNRQIQFLNHITGYKQRNIDNSKPSAAHSQENQVHFLLSNMFVLVEIQCNTKQHNLNEETVTGVKAIVRKNLDTFQKIWNNGGIVPQRCYVKLATNDNEFNQIEQYYFVDSRN